MIEEVLYWGIDIVITMIEGYYLYYLMKDYLKESVGIFRKILFFFIYTCNIVLMTQFSTPVWVKTSISLLIIIIVGKKIFDLKVQLLIFFAIFYYVAILSGEQIVIQLVKVTGAQAIIGLGNKKTYILEVMILSKFITFLIIAIIKRLMTSKKSKITLKEISPYLVSNITLFGILIFLSFTTYEVANTKYAAALPVISMLVLITGIYNVIASTSYIEIIEKEHKEKTISYEMKLKAEYYQNKLKDDERLRGIYHDMKNHMLLLQQQELDNTAQDIIKDLNERIEKYGKYIETGNEFLNIIINDKAKAAAKENIKFEVIVNFKSGGFMNPLDISTIFGNSIDNAIEACGLLEEEARFIQLKGDKRNNFLVISVVNSCAGTNSVSVGLQTNKEDKFHHGLGIKSIVNAVKKYDGECNFSMCENVFTLNLVVPISEKRKMED